MAGCPSATSLWPPSSTRRHWCERRLSYLLRREMSEEENLHFQRTWTIYCRCVVLLLFWSRVIKRDNWPVIHVTSEQPFKTFMSLSFTSVLSAKYFCTVLLVNVIFSVQLLLSWLTKKLTRKWFFSSDWMHFIENMTVDICYSQLTVFDCAEWVISVLLSSFMSRQQQVREHLLNKGHTLT